MAVSRNDLLDLVSRLKHRAHTLNMLADGMCVRGEKNLSGNALGLLSEDMQGDLAVLFDGLEALEVRS